MTGRQRRGTGSWTGQRRAFPSAVRRRILKRDSGLCVYCGAAASIADHIVPVAEGGTDDEDNGQAMCEPCHNLKTKQEIARGRARQPQRKREQEPHPGIIT